MGRRHTFADANDKAGQSIVGFLDINFGVLGIFIIVFAIRLLLTPQPTGDLPNLIVSFETYEEGPAFVAVLHQAEGDQRIEEASPGDFATALVQALTEQATVLEAPLSISALISPEVIDVEYRLDIAARRLSQSQGEGFVGVLINKRPIASLDAREGIVQEWRAQLGPGGHGDD